MSTKVLAYSSLVGNDNNICIITWKGVCLHYLKVKYDWFLVWKSCTWRNSITALKTPIIDRERIRMQMFSSSTCNCKESCFPSLQSESNSKPLYPSVIWIVSEFWSLEFKPIWAKYLGCCIFVQKRMNLEDMLVRGGQIYNNDMWTTLLYYYYYYLKENVMYGPILLMRK